MRRPSRRQVLRLASVSGFVLGAGLPERGAAQDAPEEEQPARQSPDRAFVLAAGMTEQEADCWARTNQLAGAYLGLPATGDGHEHVHAIHVVQEKLLVRPTYRRYLESAGAGERVVPASADLEQLAQPVDRERAVEAGLTEEEAECWELLALVAVDYRALPKQHPMEDHEVAHGLHALRGMILERATRRRCEELERGR